MPRQHEGRASVQDLEMEGNMVAVVYEDLLVGMSTSAEAVPRNCVTGEAATEGR